MSERGVDLLVGQLSTMGIKDFFYLVGGPMSEVMERCIESGMRGIDVRDERAATYAAIAYARVSQRPGVVMTCSGPGTINTVTGVAHAFADGAPLVVLGGSAAAYLRGTGVFQETDQVGVMRPITKWSHQVADPDGIPEAMARAFQIAQSGAPGPVYLDLPSDVLYGESGTDGTIVPVRPKVRASGDEQSISAAADLLTMAERPVVIAGSGVLWSQAWDALRDLVETGQFPFYTTPIARGLLPEDHPLSLAAARSTAFSESDCILVVGTRDNYIVNYLRPPIINSEASVIEINANELDLSRNRLADVAILADADCAIRQLLGAIGPKVHHERSEAWRKRLGEIDRGARARQSEQLNNDEQPIHPLRLCKELDALLPRDAIRVIDGHETLGFSRRAISAYLPGSMLTPGAYGTMGVGVPFGLGAKVASSASPVVVLTGDGAFGYHAMEIDTAVRHSLGVVFVIANNGGWTSGRGRPGRFLGNTAYERIANVFECYGTKVSEPSTLKPAIFEALEYAANENRPAIVNVHISEASSSGRSFSRYTRYGESHYEPV